MTDVAETRRGCLDLVASLYATFGEKLVLSVVHKSEFEETWKELGNCAQGQKTSGEIEREQLQLWREILFAGCEDYVSFRMQVKNEALKNLSSLFKELEWEKVWCCRRENVTFDQSFKQLLRWSRGVFNQEIPAFSKVGETKTACLEQSVITLKKLDETVFDSRMTSFFISLVLLILFLVTWAVHFGCSSETLAKAYKKLGSLKIFLVLGFFLIIIFGSCAMLWVLEPWRLAFRFFKLLAVSGSLSMFSTHLVPLFV